MKKILVPTDFSPAARTAGEYAALLAGRLGASLQLLHVYTEPVPAINEPVVWAAAEEELQEANSELIQEEQRFLKEKYDVEISGVARMGLTGDSIYEQALESGAGLVVMGMKRDKSRRFTRSAVFSVVRKMKIPMIVVPEGYPSRPLRDVVLAVDFGGVRDVSCFEPLFDLVTSFDATLQVLHVAGKEAVVKEEELQGKLQLGRILASKTYWYHELDEDNVEGSILRFTQEHPADLLVMVAHRHTFLERVFGTVHTRLISSQTAIPLLVLEDKEA